MSNVCIQCGETREAIRLHKLICGTVTYEGELDHEWPRHRFKPFSAKELAAIVNDEAQYIKQMGEMADFTRLTENK